MSGGTGDACGHSLPVVFTRVDNYQGWIAAALQAVDSQQGLPGGLAVPGVAGGSGQAQPAAALAVSPNERL